MMAKRNGLALAMGIAVLSACSGKAGESSEPSEDPAPRTFTVSADGSHVTVSPAGPVSVEEGATQAFTVTADADYTRLSAVGGDCPKGAWDGNTYTTGAIDADCSVKFSAAIETFAVTPSGSHVIVSPSGTQTVEAQTQASFTVTAETGYALAETVEGTCPEGLWSEQTYTTGTITADCTVQFGATLSSYLVTSTGSHVSVAPAAPQAVNHGDEASFTVEADHGYELSQAVGGTCPEGTWSGDVYTTGSITEGCSVAFEGTRKRYTVQASGSNLTIAPSETQSALHGSTVAFEVLADAGFAVTEAVEGTCPGGSWQGDVYTTGAIEAGCTVIFSSIPLYVVTPSGTDLTFAPDEPQTVRAGESGSFEVIASSPFLLDRAVGGTCAPGSWVGDVYTTGPVTADCSVVFSRGCEACGGECVAPLGAPTAAVTHFADFEVCADTCAITSRLEPSCGTCDGGCGLGESCVNGQCRCVAGSRVCTRMLEPPKCSRPGCVFLEGSGPLASPQPFVHHLVEVNGRKNETLWIHLQFRSVLPSTYPDVTYPYAMECDNEAGVFLFPSSPRQPDYFEDDGTIPDIGELEKITTIRRKCLPFEQAPPIYSFFNSLAVKNKGYYVAFTPNQGETGYAYNQLGVIVVPKTIGNGPTLDIVQYRINILADPGEEITVTSSASEPLAVEPLGPQALAYGATPSFTIDRGGRSGDVVVRGTCPRGTWSGDVYTIDRPLQASCQVEFFRGTPLYMAGPNGSASPYAGSEGGAEFGPDTCPAGHALVGLRGHHAGNIGTLAAVCAPVTVLTQGGVTTIEVEDDFVSLDTHGMTKDAPVFDARCPQGSVITRVDGYADATAPGDGVTAGLHELSVYCSALSWSGSSLVVGTPELEHHVESSWSMAGSTPFSFACSGQEAIVSIQGRAGAWLDGVGFRCGAPKPTFP